MSRLRGELMAHFERRFEADLKYVRENCATVNISYDIGEEKGGRLTATVTLTCTNGGKVTKSPALYEYRQRQSSGGAEGWYCYNDWRD